MEKVFLRNLWFRTLIPLVLVGVVNVSCNTLVIEISSGNKVFWSEIPQKLSFYILLISTIMLFLYQIQIFKHDKDMMKGFSVKQYEAAIRNKVAEDVAERSKKLIRDGDIEQLEKETEIFNRLYGEANK